MPPAVTSTLPAPMPGSASSASVRSAVGGVVGKGGGERLTGAGDIGGQGDAARGFRGGGGEREGPGPDRLDGRAGRDALAGDRLADLESACSRVHAGDGGRAGCEAAGAGRGGLGQLGESEGGGVHGGDRGAGGDADTGDLLADEERPGLAGEAGDRRRAGRQVSGYRRFGAVPGEREVEGAAGALDVDGLGGVHGGLAGEERDFAAGERAGELDPVAAGRFGDLHVVSADGGDRFEGFLDGGGGGAGGERRGRFAFTEGDRERARERALNGDRLGLVRRRLQADLGSGAGGEPGGRRGVDRHAGRQGDGGGAQAGVPGAGERLLLGHVQVEMQAAGR